MTARGLLRIVCWGDLTANIMARFYFCGKYLEIVGCEIVNLEIDVNLIVWMRHPLPSVCAQSCDVLLGSG